MDFWCNVFFADPVLWPSVYSSDVKLKEGLARYLVVLDECVPGARPWIGEEGVALERGLTYGRLALIEERGSKTIAADAFWIKAEEEIQKAQRRDPSRANLRRIIEHLDRKREATKASKGDE